MHDAHECTHMSPTRVRTTNHNLTCHHIANIHGMKDAMDLKGYQRSSWDRIAKRTLAYPHPSLSVARGLVTARLCLVSYLCRQDEVVGRARCHNPRWGTWLGLVFLKSMRTGASSGLTPPPLTCEAGAHGAHKYYTA